MDQFQMLVLIASGVLTLVAISEKVRDMVLTPFKWLFFRPHQEIRSTMDERFVALSTQIDQVSARQEVKIIEMNAMKFGLVAILCDLIYGYCQQYICDGEVSVTDKKNLERLYDAYAGLGGNGTGHDLYVEVCKLPIKIEQ